VLKLFEKVLKLFFRRGLTFRAVILTGPGYRLWLSLFYVLGVLQTVIFGLVGLFFSGNIIFIWKYVLVHNAVAGSFIVHCNGWELVYQLSFLFLSHFFFELKHTSELINHLLHLTVKKAWFYLIFTDYFIEINVVLEVISLLFVLFFVIWVRLLLCWFFVFWTSERCRKDFNNGFHFMWTAKANLRIRVFLRGWVDSEN